MGYIVRMHRNPSHRTAVLLALLVTFLWSTSWVLIKIGLHDIPALTFAGLRYVLAFLCLLPLVTRSSSVRALRSLSRSDWLRLAVLGLVFYSATQGAQFASLAFLPAVTVSLMLNLTPLLVAGSGIVLLSETPTVIQWGGVALNLLGLVVYFFPISLPGNQVIGLLIAAVGVLTNAGSAILGRHVNRQGHIDALVVTTVSMGIGAVVLLATGILIQGLPPLSLIDGLLIIWLAVVNTACAFTLWNHAQRTLSAMESSIINGTMLVQIALLAWLFLGEQITFQQGIGLILAAAGVLIVQLRWQPETVTKKERDLA